MGWRAYSLRIALVVAVVLPLVAVVGGTGYVGLRVLEQREEERLQEDVELVARAIRLPVGRALERDREGAVERALESAFRIQRVYSAHVYDVDGEKIAAVGPGAAPAEQDRLTELAAEGARTGEYGEVAGRGVYSYFVPLTAAGGRGVGLLQVTRSRREIREYIGRLRSQGLLLLLLGAGVLAALVLYGHHGAVGVHLARLGRTMARIRRGDRHHRARLEGPREVRSLATTLNGMLDSMAGAEREIEERREEQEELREQLQQAEKMAAIGRLAAGVAHELGTPLSVIDGVAQRGLRESTPAGRGTEALRVVREEVRRMERIVQQLLDFGRRRSVRRRTLRMAEVARSAAATVREEFGRVGTELELAGPTPGPELRADPVRIDQALTNLLRNAMQAAPGGRVRLEWTAADGEMAFEVADDGPGIAPEVRPQLFEPFFSTKPVGEGTGLGLAVVHGVADEHDGRVEVGASGLGGASFRLVVPADPGAADRPASARAGEAAGVVGRGKTSVVKDDGGERS